MWFLIDKADSPALAREEIAADWEELELRLQSLSKYSKASFECEKNVLLSWFPF